MLGASADSIVRPDAPVCGVTALPGTATGAALLSLRYKRQAIRNNLPMPSVACKGNVQPVRLVLS
jgi:hypothetical protein